MELFDQILDIHISINFLLFIAGVIVLVKGSDVFVDSAVYFAKRFNISEIIVGLTLVSIGTSLPELATNINSALKARTAIAIGNVTGSNITNIALIIGISALIIGRLKVPKKLIKRDMIFMLLITLLLLTFSYFFDGDKFVINRFEAIIMVVLFVFYIIYLFRFEKDEVSQEIKEYEELKINKMWVALSFFFLGLIGIFFGSEIMVRNVIVIADKLYISDGVIGATIVALGTSIPELSVTIVSIIKKRSDISLGNIVGSNIFNILAVLGLTGIIRQIDIINVIDGTPDKILLYWTLPLAMGVSLLLFIFMLINKQLGRIKGTIFLLIYIGFIVFNFTGFPK